MPRHSGAVTLGAHCAARLILLKGMERSQENEIADKEGGSTLTFINLCAVDHSGCHHLIRFSITENTFQLTAKAPVGNNNNKKWHYRVLQSTPC